MAPGQKQFELKSSTLPVSVESWTELWMGFCDYLNFPQAFQKFLPWQKLNGTVFVSPGRLANADGAFYFVVADKTAQAF